MVVPETIRHDYEVSSEGAVRHWEIPYARMTDTTPTPTLPAEVTCLTAGLNLTGTILTIHARTSVAIIDFTCGMVYYNYVRNVLTYVANAEATWGAINIGDCIYYDEGSTMVALGLKLSTSPLDAEVATNSLFGWAVPRNDTDMALFPLGGALAGSTQELSVMQRGAGSG